jgi:aminomuconate-semialdehyde/2-hydroxymuconate-6-semialdehyde dehydrogenase
MADTRDMGKPISDARSKDVPRTAQNFRFFADHARLAMAETLPMDTGHHAYTRYEPAGVVAAVAPWNFPLMLESWKVAPALAWGNTVVLKPAEDTPASATLLARLALEAGIPPGVLNVLHGYGPDSAGSALTEDPRVDRITFTGESGTGRIITGAAAKNLTPVSLELGGKGANLVFADADLDNAVDWSIKAVFTNAGQVCLAGSRLYVERPILDEFLARFVAAAERLVIGDPKDPATQLGPLASLDQREILDAQVRKSVRLGARVLTGGHALDGPGAYYAPTVLTDVPRESPAYREELFGPVAMLFRAPDADAAIRLANDTRFGLGASVWTNDAAERERFADEIESGLVFVNAIVASDPRLPFGGVKKSGYGRELAVYGLRSFVNVKTI